MQGICKNCLRMWNLHADGFCPYCHYAAVEKEVAKEIPEGFNPHLDFATRAATRPQPAPALVGANVTPGQTPPLPADRGSIEDTTAPTIDLDLTHGNPVVRGEDRADLRAAVKDAAQQAADVQRAANEAPALDAASVDPGPDAAAAQEAADKVPSPKGKAARAAAPAGQAGNASTPR